MFVCYVYLYVGGSQGLMLESQAVSQYAFFSVLAFLRISEMSSVVSQVLFQFKVHI